MNKKSVRILVVDDDTDICEVIKTHLNWRGFDQIDVSHSSKDAKETFSKKPHDIVLADVKMPIQTGVDLLQELKSIRPESLVIMITGDSALNDVIRCQALGALDFVFKPFGNFGDLDAVMDRAIQIITRWNRIIDKVRGVDVF